MEWITEILFEILFEGILEGAGSRRVPVVVRILLGAILAIAYLTLLTLLAGIAVRTGEIAAILCAVLVLVLGIALAVKMFYKCRK